MKPTLTLVAGLPASGKTWFARAWAEKTGARHINSDSVRAELGLRGHYDAPSKQRIYEEMLRRAEAALSQGESVVADSTFYKKSLREPWEQLAARLGVRLHWVEMIIPDELARQRLQTPRPDSEASWEVYRQLLQEREPLDTPHLSLYSENESLADMFAKAEKYWQP